MGEPKQPLSPSKEMLLNVVFVLRKTMEYYADVRNYDPNAPKSVLNDKGELARKGLSMLSKL